MSRLASVENPNHLSCFPYSVGHSTEGVCLLLKLGKYRILLDCGLADIETLLSESHPPADMVFCSHAHSDHAQGLLALHEAFPQIPIYASEVTVKLLPLNWLERNAAEIPQFCQSLPWSQRIKLENDLSVELFPAGHLPGAACLVFHYQTGKRTYKILYTGDFCLSNFQLVEGLSLETLRGLAPDVLIIEGSYGSARHPHRRQQEKQLVTRIKEAIARQQNILLPVPTLGNGQEILKLLRSHHQFTGRDLDIWVDGSIAVACDTYLEILSQFPPSVQNFAKHQPLFWDQKVCPRMGRLTEQQKQNLGQSPCIVITDYTADLREYCHQDLGSWLILVPQHPRNFINPEIENSPQIIFETYLLSEHSDGRNTTQLIHNLRPQHIIFFHASPTYLADLTNLEELHNRYQIHSPAALTLVELPIGDKFIQPEAPQQSAYEGELNEIGAFVSITLPDTINKDPRWNNFADTGLIEARWQGEELVIRGLSQRELQNKTNDRMPTDIDCCNTCLYYQNQRCWHQASPLYGFQVTPEGYCPVFEPRENNEP
ncbi:MAG: MBL fold metallo-hydrolase [Gomphosphaeria aponina SAG 52.96 = DSM 107014]|uniref:MBL fold metallo-hydrolase n=1 Tax=Gomphosphaeria aponina SAG 52.96 = DSM 107014 TaxID=1521640 RepID=A0A941GUP9_9CHRO|nr:MBL fold metallo-hydrolase [Gomphosphaeria aponina SAG 52.96 = DSM 107014]